MAGLEEQVSLDITAALTDADQLATQAGEALEAALTAAVDSFTSSFSTAADSIQSQLAEALSAEQTVPVGADTAPAQAEVASLVAEADAQQAEITVSADTADAESQVSGLADSVDAASSSLSTGASSSKGFADSAGLVAGSAALARGEVGGLSEVAGGLGVASIGAITGTAALAGSVYELAQKGIEATSAEERFNTILGESAQAVERVKVGSLTTDLGKLGLQFGSTDADVKNSAAGLFQFAVNSGASRAEAATFTTQVAALSARAVSLNPQLGSLSDVADSLGIRLARGGRFAAAYGLSLTAAEINTRALANTHKEAAGDLTIYEKAQAAAQIAVERYGNTLGDVVAKGAKNAANEQKSLKAQLEQTLETAGKPLVSPVLELFKDSQPAIAATATSLGQLAVAALPAVEGALQAAVPLLQTAASTLGALTDATDAVGLSATTSGAAIGFMVAGPWGALAGATAGLVSDLGLVQDSTAGLRKDIDGLSSSVAKLDATAALEHFNKVVRDTVSAGDGLDTGLTRQNVSLRLFKQVADEDAGAAQKLLAAMQANGDNTSRYQSVLDRTTASQRSSTAETKTAAEATQLLTGAYADQIKVLNEKDDALLASYDVTFASIHADEAERDAIATLNTAYDDAIKSGKSQQEAQEAQNRALVAAEEAATRASKAVRDKSESDNAGLGSQAAAIQATRDQIGSLEGLVETLDPGSPLRVFLEQYIVKLKNEIPPAVATTVTADTSQAQTALDRLTASMREIRGQSTIGNGENPTPFYIAAEGMVVEPRPGGTLVNVAEAGHREVILPTDDDSRALALLEQSGLGRLLAPNVPRSLPTGLVVPAATAPVVQLEVVNQLDARGLMTTTIRDVRTGGTTLAVQKQKVRAGVASL